MKTIKLTHPFIYQCHDIENLLQNVNKIATFCSKLEKQSNLYPNRYDPEKYKGDGFELFCETLIKLSPVDNRIGISDYKIIKENEDIGVDGFGIGIDRKPATVQCKYRSNSCSLLTANEDHLTNFSWASVSKYKVDVNTKTNMLIITTAEGLHHFTNNQMLQNQVRCLSYSNLRELTDNNILFWDAFRELIKENVKNK